MPFFQIENSVGAKWTKIDCVRVQGVVYRKEKCSVVRLPAINSVGFS